MLGCISASLFYRNTLSCTHISKPGITADVQRIKNIKSLFKNKCYRQGGHSSSRFLFVMRELWGSITTEEQTKICRRITDNR